MSDPNPQPSEGVAAARSGSEAPRRGLDGAWLGSWLMGGCAATLLEVSASLTEGVTMTAGGVVLVASLYSLTALGAAGVTLGLERLAAPGGLHRARAAVLDALRQGRSGHAPGTDRATSAALVSAVTTGVSAALLMGLGAALVAAQARDPQWFGLAVGIITWPALGLAVLLGMMVRRGLLAARHVPSPRALALGLTLAPFALALGALLRYRETLGHLGAYAVFLPTLMVSVTLAVFVLAPRRLAHPARLALALALLASVAVVISWRLPRARSFVVRDTWSAAYMVAGLQALSDLDRDGVASFPFGADCAPLDAARHPLAREVASNGVDENCDGLDSVVEGPARAAGDSAFVALNGEQPDLFLITIDALRADHLGFMGYSTHPTSPDLDALAEGGVIFERAYSQDSGTAPSMWSLMVGKTPFQVELVAEGFPPNYGPSETTLAQRLKAAGYTTHARLCGSLFTAPGWSLRQGFDEFEEVCQRRPRDLAPYVLDSARSLLEPPPAGAASSELDRPPRFVWLHFFDPHHPYVDHGELSFGDEPVDLYDEEVRYVQTFVAEALRLALDDAHTRPRVAVLSADHGENFDEHGRDPHARTLYREVIHVPLVVFGAGFAPHRVEEPVALGDLFPTLLNLAGVPTPASSTMESLVPALLGVRPDPARVVFQENSWSRPTHHVKSLVRGRYHLIRDLTTDTVELYDMLSDPRERVNRADEGIPEQAELMRLLEAFIATTNIPEAYR